MSNIKSFNVNTILVYVGEIADRSLYACHGRDMFITHDKILTRRWFDAGVYNKFISVS